MPKPTCTDCGRPMQAAKSMASIPRCQECRRKSPRHGSAKTYSVHGCRCGPCTRAKTDEHRAYLQRRSAKESTPKPLCDVCGQPVSRARSDTPRHRACKDTLPEWRRYKRPGPHQRRLRKLLDRAAKGTASRQLWRTGPCPWCGEQYTARTAYCSDTCRRDAAWARRSQRAFKPSPAQRKRIYERDAWTCAICHLPVDRQASTTEAWAPTLDHIVPQVTQLVPDHSDANLRTAHQWCNSRRGAGEYGTDADVAREAHARRALELAA